MADRYYTEAAVRAMLVEAVEEVGRSPRADDSPSAIASRILATAPPADLRALAEAVRLATTNECVRLAEIKAEQADTAYATGKREASAEFTVRRDTYYAAAGCIRSLDLAPVLAKHVIFIADEGVTSTKT